MAGRRSVLEPGERRGMLLVKSRDGKYALCRCDCGTRKRIDAHQVASGKVTHCGCLKKKATP
jgi:hypothetical protein